MFYSIILCRDEEHKRRDEKLEADFMVQILREADEEKRRKEILEELNRAKSLALVSLLPRNNSPPTICIFFPDYIYPQGRFFLA
jgi:hypothetical protein